MTQKRLIHGQIQYIEFLSGDIGRARNFYSASFGWTFKDYGPDYTAFEGEYVDGGFATGKPVRGSILVILYSNNLEGTKKKVTEAGGNSSGTFSLFPVADDFNFWIRMETNSRYGRIWWSDKF